MKEKSIVVINSTGPMASTVVGSLVEKFSYINIPVRKLGLHDYLTGNKNIDNPYFKNRFKNVVESHSKPVLMGGVSVSDRDSSSARVLIDLDLVADELKQFEDRKFKNISELYHESRSIYYKAVTYKETLNVDQAHIEYTTDISRFDGSEITKSYQDNFDNVFMINLTRDFKSWLDSLSSQRFKSPSFRDKYLLVIHSAVKQYKIYHETIEQIPGLNIKFEEMFLPHTPKLVQKLEKFLGANPITSKLEDEEFDLYGKTSDYQKTFSMADTGNQYLSRLTLRFAYHCSKKTRVTVLDDLIFEILYLLDLARFKVFGRKSKKDR